MKNKSILPQAPVSKPSQHEPSQPEVSNVETPPAAPSGGAGQMDQVRELLFGEQARSTAAHFSQVEARIDGLEGELQASRQLMNERFDDLIERMEKANQVQVDSLKAVADGLRSQLREEQERAEKEADELRTDLRERHEQALRDLAKLQTGKADRRVVSDLMHDLANRLSEDGEEPSR